MNYRGSDLLVEPDWLEARLSDSGLTIVDCDAPEQYQRAHIPGAVAHRTNHFLKDPEDARFILKPAQFAEAMASLGIDDDSDVICYDASAMRYASRLWWCLNYYGFGRVRLLNGGWDRWLADGRPMTMKPSQPRPAGKLTLRPDAGLYADADFVRQILTRPDALVLDVRSDPEWLGTDNRGNKRAGHMPGAVHVEFLNNLSADGSGSFKPEAELREMFVKAGVTPEKEVVTVCQAGVRASQAAFALRLLGYGRVRVYDGSFLDWANREDTPLQS